jgi:acyl-CoA thioesterase-2
MRTSLHETLTLEQLEINLFRGRSPQEEESKRIFGGQVIAQALMAAYHTVEDRICHSLHCYFIRPGDPSIPIVFEVDRSRDGKSFTTRRVIAIQHGQQIFNLAASFQVVEPGFEHQDAAPGAGEPQDFAEMVELQAEYAARMPEAPVFRFRHWPLEWRLIDLPTGFDPADTRLEPRQRAWFRLREAIGDDLKLHQAVLAYCSDVGLLGASARAHGVHWTSPRLQTASLDHAMWFHHPSDITQWHLYDMRSPSASGARGFNLGAIYRQDGTLVASAAQEGLIRYHPER